MNVIVCFLVAGDIAWDHRLRRRVEILLRLTTQEQCPKDTETAWLTPSTDISLIWGACHGYVLHDLYDSGSLSTVLLRSTMVMGIHLGLYFRQVFTRACYPGNQFAALHLVSGGFYACLRPQSRRSHLILPTVSMLGIQSLSPLPPDSSPLATRTP